MTAPQLRALARHSRSASRPALVLAAAIPFIFLHAQYQPSASADAVRIDLSDVAIGCVIVAALSCARIDLSVLRRTLAVWAPLALFVLWLFASMAWARSDDPSYALGARATSALKYLEYALLAPAVALILRSAADRLVVYASVVAWSMFLSCVAALQFLGLVNEFDGRRALQREPAYIGIHELGSFSAAALVLAFAAILLHRHGTVAKIGGVAGAFGVALAAAFDSLGGVAVVAVTSIALARRRNHVSWRRVLAVAGIVFIVGVGAVTLRGNAVSAFLEFVGVRPPSQQTNSNVQTDSQRVVLGYIGLKIWLDHPVLGAGWQESQAPKAFQPQLAAARRRFPDVAPASFPSTAHEWGVQNGIIQTLSDLGIVGFLLLAGAVVAAATTALRAVRTTADDVGYAAIVATGWIIVAFAVFTGTGLLPGSPMQALLSLSLGLAASLG